jgi:hypothetical protein
MIDFMLINRDWWNISITIATHLQMARERGRERKKERVRDNDDDEKIFIYELSICIYLMVDFGLAHFVILLGR